MGMGFVFVLSRRFTTQPHRSLFVCGIVHLYSQAIYNGSGTTKADYNDSTGTAVVAVGGGGSGNDAADRPAARARDVGNAYAFSFDMLGSLLDTFGGFPLLER